MDVVRDMVANMEAAWNAGNGEQFARDFAEDADFVNIRADHHQGKQAIAAGHQAIFDTMYKGSKNRYEVATVRELTPDVVLAHVTSVLECPTGPMAGTNRALFSAVFVKGAEGWKVASFHNTLVPPAQR